jgi:hypothetical protein
MLTPQMLISYASPRNGIWPLTVGWNFPTLWFGFSAMEAATCSSNVLGQNIPVFFCFSSSQSFFGRILTVHKIEAGSKLS